MAKYSTKLETKKVADKNISKKPLAKESVLRTKKVEVNIVKAKKVEPKKAVVKTTSVVKKVEPKKAVVKTVPVIKKVSPKKAVVKTVPVVKKVEPKKAVVKTAPVVKKVEPKKAVVKSAPVVKKAEPKKALVKPAPVVKKAEPKKVEVKPAPVVKKAEPKKVEVKPAPVVKKAEPKKALVKPVPVVKKAEPKKVEVKPVPVVKKTEPKKVEVKPVPVVKKTEPKKVEVKPVPVVKKTEPKKVEVKPVPVVKKTEPKKIIKEVEEVKIVKEPQEQKAPEKHTSNITTRTSYPEKINYRLSQIYFHLFNEKVEGIYISYLPNIKYLTGFSGSQADLFIFKNSIHFITDDRYEEQIKTELYPLPNMQTHITRDLWGYVAEIGLLSNVDAIAFESDKVSYYDAVEFRNHIRPCKFKPAPNLVEPFTTSKAAEEIEYIKQACKIAEDVYDDILKFIQPGMTEKDVANEISYSGRKKGAEGESFDIIVTSGHRGAIIHGQPTDKKIRRGDIVLMDFGFKIKGFSSDISRTICVGAKPTREQRNLYSVLREAEMKAIKAVLPGMNGKTLDAIVRKVIEDAGYKDIAYQHALGHGLGIVTHEHPFLTFRRDDQIVPDDSVLAIEPGAYIPDKYGMRVEDNIYVTKNGAVMLTNAPDELPYIL